MILILTQIHALLLILVKLDIDVRKGLPCNLSWQTYFYDSLFSTFNWEQFVKHKTYKL